jgi:hypothetical protein
MIIYFKDIFILSYIDYPFIFKIIKIIEKILEISKLIIYRLDC